MPPFGPTPPRPTRRAWHLPMSTGETDRITMYATESSTETRIERRRTRPRVMDGESRIKRRGLLVGPKTSVCACAARRDREDDDRRGIRRCVWERVPYNNQAPTPSRWSCPPYPGCEAGGGVEARMARLAWRRGARIRCAMRRDQGGERSKLVRDERKRMRKRKTETKTD